jgi:YggT family protein
MTLLGLIGLALQLLALAIFIRVLLTWLPIAPWHPAVRFLDRITEPVVAPLRRVVPPIAGLDLSPAVAILLLITAANVVTSRLTLAGALWEIVNFVLLVLIVLVLVRAIFSLIRFDPWNPIVQAVQRATEPGLRPLRQWFPARRPVDVAAVLMLAALLVLYWALRNLFAGRLLSGY